MSEIDKKTKLKHDREWVGHQTAGDHSTSVTA